MRGTQGGFDLSIEWNESCECSISGSGKCEVNSQETVRCHIECKNYASKITPADIFEKLLAEPLR